MGAALRSAQYAIAAITFVIEERVSQVSHVGTYLMGAAGLEHTLHQRNIAKAFQHLVVSNGMFADVGIGRKHRHLHAVFGMATNVSFDASALFLKVAPYQCIVSAACGFAPSWTS